MCDFQIGAVLDSIDEALKNIETLKKKMVEMMSRISGLAVLSKSKADKEKLNQLCLHAAENIGVIEVKTRRAQRLIEPPPIEDLPRPALHNVIKYLSVQGKNNLRLTSNYFADTLPSIDSHYESGMLPFSRLNFKERMHAVDELLKKAKCNPANMNISINLWSTGEFFCLDVYDKEGQDAHGVIRFSKDAIEISFDIDKLIKTNVNDIQYLKSLIKYLRSRKVVKLDLHRQNKARLLFSDLDFVSLSCLELNFFWKGPRRETLSLIEKYSRQLESLTISCCTGTLDIQCRFPRLTYLDLDSVSKDNIKLLEASAESLTILCVARLGDFQGMSKKFNQLRAIRALDAEIIQILPYCSNTLECLMIRSSLCEEQESDKVGEIYQSLKLPVIRQLSIDISGSKSCLHLLNKCRYTLNYLEVVGPSEYDLDGIVLDPNDTKIELPQIKELVLMGDDPALLNILDGCSTTIEVLRLDLADDLLMGLNCQLPKIKKIVVHTSDRHIINFLNKQLACSLQVEMDFSSDFYDTEKLRNRYGQKTGKCMTMPMMIPEEDDVVDHGNNDM